MLMPVALEATFNSTDVITNMMNGVQSQIYSVLGIVAPIVGSITVAIVLIKFGQKWIKKVAQV